MKNIISEMDTHLFKEGSHFRLYEKLGAHEMKGGSTLRSGHPMRRG
jgi:hypothetical protein